MLESTYLMTAAVSLIMTVLGIVIVKDWSLTTLLCTAAFVGWGIVAYGSLDVRVVGDAVTYTFSMPEVTVFAALMSLVPGYVALIGPAEAIGQRVGSPRQEDI